MNDIIGMLLGRSAAPPVQQGLSDEDLARMEFQLHQQGNTAALERLREVRASRPQVPVAPQAAPQQGGYQLPQPIQQSIEMRQMLLNALGGKPKR